MSWKRWGLRWDGLKQELTMSRGWAIGTAFVWLVAVLIYIDSWLEVFR